MAKLVHFIQWLDDPDNAHNKGNITQEEKELGIEQIDETSARLTQLQQQTAQKTETADGNEHTDTMPTIENLIEAW